MRHRSRETTLYALVATAAGLAGAFATAGWTRSFVVLPIDDLIVELTPARVVNYAIENVGEEAHLLHVLGAFAVAAGLFAAAATGGLLAARRFDRPLAGGGLGAVLTGTVSLTLTGVLLPSIAAGLAVGTVVIVGTAAESPASASGASSAGADQGRSPASASGDAPASASGDAPASATAEEFSASTTTDESPVSGAGGSAAGESQPDGARRTLVGTIAATISFVGLSMLLGRRVTNRAQEIDERLPADERVEGLLATAAETSLDSPAISPPVSPIGEFYRIDINSTPPIVAADDWRLTIRGAVEREVTIDYDELRDRERVDEFVALRCIGESLNGDKLDTALWSGTPIEPLLERAGPTGEYVELHSADGYVSTFGLAHLRGGLLAYGMNGRVLPREHGHPVRAVMPGTWGKLNNKWLTDVVIVEEPTEGYWEERGWRSEAPITAVAKLWTVRHLDDGRVEVGGHAYAGTRGVERVEVSTDGGETWTDAELAELLPGEDVTRQWRHRYEADEPHEVVVRTVDGEGSLQTATRSDSFPAGASGWVSREVDPR